MTNACQVAHSELSQCHSLLALHAPFHTVNVLLMIPPTGNLALTLTQLVEVAAPGITSLFP